MIAPILALISIQLKASFTILHHVVLSDPVLTTFDVRRDGSLAGSCGELGLHDGSEVPLIVRHGKQIKLANEYELSSCQVAAMLPNREFEVQLDYKETRRAAVVNGRLKVLGPIASVSVDKGVSSIRTLSDPIIDKLFPIPENMRDTAGIESVYWYTFKNGLRLGQVETSSHMEHAHSVALREFSSQTYPLENCVRGLEGYRVCGICYVSRQGWFVVSAVRKQKRPSEGIELGFGNELFWIEPRS